MAELPVLRILPFLPVLQVLPVLLVLLVLPVLPVLLHADTDTHSHTLTHKNTRGILRAKRTVLYFCEGQRQQKVLPGGHNRAREGQFRGHRGFSRTFGKVQENPNCCWERNCNPLPLPMMEWNNPIVMEEPQSTTPTDNPCVQPWQTTLIDNHRQPWTTRNSPKQPLTTLLDNP